MARFSAFDGDSDEDGSSSDDSYEAQQLLTGAGPSKNRTIVPPREVSAEPDDDDGNTDDGDKEDEDEEDDSGLSDVAVDGSRLVDPSLIPRARELGIDRQKMLVMQSTFFGLPQEAAIIQDALHEQPSRKALIPPTAISRKHSRDSDGEGLRGDSRQRESFAHDIEPPPFRPSRKYARVESSASVVAGHEDAIIDSGLSFGRSFRVGWGPGGALAHVGSLSAPWSTSSSTANSSLVTISTAPLISATAQEANDAALLLLSHHLSNTTIAPDDDGVPQATPRPVLTFASLAGLFPATDKSFQASLFRLGHALFDPIDLRLGHAASSDLRDHVEALRRKIALSSWLQDAVSPTIEAEVDESLSGQQGWARAAFSLLTGNQVERACEVALDSSNVKLATLISQVGGDADFRSDIQHQLDIWREQKVDVHMDENIRKIYALLAGIVDVLKGSSGTGLERCSDLSIGKGLDWKRAFGLHLWFGESFDATIVDSLKAYEELVNNDSPHNAPPVPWYREGDTTPKSAWKLPSETSPPDALFSLIKLFADPGYLLSQVLAPFSFSSSPSDYRLPWHLYILLSRSLRVRDFTDRSDTSVDGQRADGADGDGDSDVENHSPSADLLANSYALQLEEMGMLQEAVFVLLHLEGSAGRKRTIQAMLARNAPKIDEWMTAGLVGSLRLPTSWVDEAKAMYALAKGEVYEAYQLYLSARMYTTAHDLAITELAPDAIIRKDLQLLKEILDELPADHVEGWHDRGKVLLDYTHVMTRLPELRARLDTLTTPNAAEAAEIEELSRSVPKLIQQLPAVFNGRGDIRHEVALSEMISGLTERLDLIRPLALGQQLRTAKVPEATKLAHLRASAYEKFLRSVEVA